MSFWMIRPRGETSAHAQKPIPGQPLTQRTQKIERELKHANYAEGEKKSVNILLLTVDRLLPNNFEFADFFWHPFALEGVCVCANVSSARSHEHNTKTTRKKVSLLLQDYLLSA